MANHYLCSNQRDDPLNVEVAKREVLEGVAARMAEAIESQGYGAVMTEDEATHGYYIMQRGPRYPIRYKNFPDFWYFVKS